MANVYTATVLLLPSLKRRGMLPSTAETLAASDFLALADEELLTYVVPIMVACHEEYFVAAYDQSVVSGTSNYTITPRAMGGKLRDVQLSDGTGAYIPLPRIAPSAVQGYTPTGSPEGYILRGNDVVLTPSPTASTGTLRMLYFRRPGTLVDVSAAALITAINTGTKVVTLSTTIPSTFTTLVTYDLIQGTPGFATRDIDLAVSAASGTSMTFSAALPTGLAVGDFVALANQSPIPQIPVELHGLLAERVAFRALQALGDPKAQSAFQVCEATRKNVLALLTPRSEGSSRPLVNYNGPGFRRGSRRY